MYNTIASSAPRTNKNHQYPKDFFGHPQANTLSDINVTRKDILDVIICFNNREY